MKKWIILSLVLAALFTVTALVMGPTASSLARAHTYHEAFSTTTYQDMSHTTAVWDTAAGQLRLPPPTPFSEQVLGQLYYASAWSPAIYVPQTGRAYLFGGLGNSNAMQEYDPVANSTKSSLVLPFPMRGAAAIYVESRQAIYLLGGSLRTDIVVLDVGHMVATVLENKLPAPRSYASAIYVPGQDKAYIFGGLQADGSLLDSVLEYDLATNTVITLPDSLPVSMSMASAIYDPESESAYIFGGQLLGYNLSSVLRFDVVQQKVITTAATTLPVACSGTSVVHVPDQHKAYIFGGLGQEELQTRLLSQIIEFDLRDSTAITLAAELPSERYGTAAVYVPSQATAYVFGGQQGPYALPDIVAFDVNQQTVTDKTVAVDARIGASGVYVPTGREVYLFGGGSGAQATSSILVYHMDGETADLLPATLPISRTDTAAAFVSVTNQAYVFGGLRPGRPDRYFADIYRFDTATKTMVTASAVLPSGRAGMSAVYVPPPTNKIYLFGGVGDSSCLDEILVYDPAQDRLTSLPAKLPQAAAYMAAAYDTTTAEIYLFGGWASIGASSEQYFNQIVAFNVATETATPVPAWLPQFMGRAAALAIPGEKTAYVIGGRFFGRNLNTIYRFDLTTKQVAGSDIRLAESRAAEVAVYVPERMTAYLFGGEGSSFQPLLNIATLQFARPLSATAQSIMVNGPGEEVHQALLTVEQDLRSGAVSYSLSNDGGQTWVDVQPGTRHMFALPGSDLRWRAVLNGGGETTPIVDSLTLEYNGIYQTLLPVILKRS